MLYRSAISTALPTIFLTLLLGCDSQEAESQEGSPTSIARVDSAQVTEEGSTIELHAWGHASTGGFTNPTLEPVIYVQFPPDSIWDVSFLVDPPAEGVAVPEVLTPHSATTVLDKATYDAVKAFRIVGNQNSVLAPRSR